MVCSRSQSFPGKLQHAIVQGTLCSQYLRRRESFFYIVVILKRTSLNGNDICSCRLSVTQFAFRVVQKM
eukprot:12395679-Karenia_brevis.AAC.1